MANLLNPPRKGIPRINLDQKLWCPKHWSPCLIEGLNGLEATLMLFTQAMRQEEFMKMCGLRRNAAGKITELASAENIQAAIDVISPLCCWLGDDKVQAIWKELRRARTMQDLQARKLKEMGN